MPKLFSDLHMYLLFAHSGGGRGRGFLLKECTWGFLLKECT